MTRRLFLKEFSDQLRKFQISYNIAFSRGLKQILRILVEEVIEREGLLEPIDYYGPYTKRDIYESLDLIISEMYKDPSEIDLEITKDIQLGGVLRDKYQRSFRSFFKPFRSIRDNERKYLTSASFLSAIHKKFCNIPPFCRRR